MKKILPFYDDFLHDLRGPLHHLREVLLGQN